MWGSKVGAVVLLAAVGLLGAYIPIFLRRCKIERFVCVLNTFAAGAFLGLALFHIMPEAAQTLEKAEFFIYVGTLRTPFNIAFLLIFVGYVVILLCEQVLTVGEDHGNSAPPAGNAGTTPLNFEAGRGGRGQGAGWDGGLLQYVAAHDSTRGMTLMSAPAAAAAKDESAAEQRRDARSPAVQAAADGAKHTSTKALHGVLVVGGDRVAGAANKEAGANVSSSKRVSVCGDEVRGGGGCGLGFPCCLMAEAAAREAARQQGRGKKGDGAATATGEKGGAVGGLFSATCSIGGSPSKGQEMVEMQPFGSRCCVLQQRQKHPRDSTRASAAGSDADDIEYIKEAALDEISQEDAPPGTARAARGDLCVETEREFRKQECCGDCGRVETLQQVHTGELHTGKEGNVAECGLACDYEGRQGQKKQQSSATLELGQTGATCEAVMLRPCGNSSSSSSAALFHPPERRQCANVSTCDAAAAEATRDTATNAACDAGSLGAGLAAAAGTGGSGGTAAATGGKDGFEVTVTARNVRSGDRCTLDLGGTQPGERWGEQQQQQQRGRLSRWCSAFCRRQRARQLQKDNADEMRRRERKGWLLGCRCCPLRLLACVLPFARELDGGAFFLMAALAIHGVFEGFVVGAESNLLSLWILTCVIAAHKWAESLLLMTQFVERHLSMTWAWTLIVIFVASSPVGIIVGACVSNESRVAAGVCNALGAGTLLFVAAEVSVQVFTGERKHRLMQLLVYCAGAGMVFGLSLLDIALEPGA